MTRRLMWVSAAAVAVTAGAVYLPSLRGEFVYDDVAQIIIDDYIHQPSHFTDVLTLRVMTTDVLDFNRPVNLLSLMIDSLLWGRRPFGYHLTNLLLHIGCSILVLLVLANILRRLAGKGRRPTWPLLGATAGALLFAVHPLNSEAVCPVTFREDLLVGLTTLVALWGVEWFPARRRWVSVALGGGCLLATLLAVGSKENGAMLPLMLLAYWLVVRQGDSRRPWLILIAASTVVVVGFMVARFALEPQNSGVFVVKPGRLGGSFTGTLEMQPRFWTFQLAEIVWPGLVCADQDENCVRNIDLPVALETLIGLTLILGAVIWRNRRVGGVTLGAMWYAIALAPASNLMPMYHPLADRYLYVPMLGVAMVVGTIVSCLRIPSKTWARAALGAAGLGILGVLACMTVQRAIVWQHPLSLWKDTVARNPKSTIAYSNLGWAYFDEGAYSEAIDAFNRSCRLEPRFGESWAGLAVTYDVLGRPQETANALHNAITCNPMYAHPPELVKALWWKPADAERLQRIEKRAIDVHN